MKKTKTVTIVANGETVFTRAALEAVRTSDLVIAADGGAGNCLLTGIQPDHIIGDFDSLPRKARDVFPEKIFRHNPDQYSTDMEKALAFARSINPGKIIILSAFGGRMDHASTNLLLLAEVNRDIPVEIWDNHGKMTILNPGTHTPGIEPGSLVSLFSLIPVTGLSLKGFMYPLENQDFSPFFIGISNVSVKKSCLVSFSSGIIYMYLQLPEDGNHP